ncbi:hypothetical protein [Micromonospora psammae]|uniref:hypothetical protein n=1 Tax=Micromonospora sp. CPCC 205556 TaxID=3122398 RepID=UPI002FF3C5ED
MQVVHQPRVAWDMARLIVAAADDDALLGWLGTELGGLLGPDCARALRDTRDRLRVSGGVDRAPIEAGRWRVRLEDLLRTRPETAEPLRSLAVVGSGLLAGRRG